MKVWGKQLGIPHLPTPHSTATPPPYEKKNVQVYNTRNRDIFMIVRNLHLEHLDIWRQCATVLCHRDDARSRHQKQVYYKVGYQLLNQIRFYRVWNAWLCRNVNPWLASKLPSSSGSFNEANYLSYAACELIFSIVTMHYNNEKGLRPS